MHGVWGFGTTPLVGPRRRFPWHAAVLVLRCTLSSRQWFDPAFPPCKKSLGNLARFAAVADDWKCALELNPAATVFKAGTDPDDVRGGPALADDWLLSAISMLSAASVGDGDVEEQIGQLFVSSAGPDGRPMYDSDVGVYAVRLFKNGQWETVLVDDHFPVLRPRVRELAAAGDAVADAAATGEALQGPVEEADPSRGAAAAHSTHFSEIWVALLEKAFAKYYGSYATLERGFVHQALRDLTGCKADCLFIAQEASGNGRAALWHALLRWQTNGYLLGAESLSLEAADPSIHKSGLVFGRTYPIFAVRALGRRKLLQLRNPPGDHPEWKGDWGDKSPLWSRRLKRKLGWRDDESDNTFWMSFDDFCNAFRCIYVCHW